MKKIARFFLWGIGSLVLILMVANGVGEYIHRAKEERRFELQAAESADATELAKCASRILSTSAIRTMILRIYYFGGFDFRELAKTYDKLGYPIGEPGEYQFKEATIRWTAGPSTEIVAVRERCQTKFSHLPAHHGFYWPSFWRALELQPEYSAVLEKLKEEDEEILAPYRRKMDARKKVEADEAQKRKDALFK